MDDKKLDDKKLKKLKKLSDLEEAPDLALQESIEELEEKIEESSSKMTNDIKEAIYDAANNIVIPEQKETNLTPVLDRLNSLEEEVKKKSTFLLSPELKKELKGEKGDTTIVEKVIEKVTEVIKEIPIVTENVVEKITEEISGEKIVDRINTQDKLINKEKIEGLDSLERLVKQQGIDPTKSHIWQGVSEVRVNEIVDKKISENDRNVDDNNYIRRDGTNSPTANIDWGANEITNIKKVSGGESYFDLENDTIGVSKLGKQTVNGFIKTKDNDGTIEVDTNTYEQAGVCLKLDQTIPQSFTGGDVTGTGLLKVTSGELGLDETEYQSQLSAGCVSMSDITDNGDGSISTDSHICNLYTNVNGTGAIKQYTIAGGTFILTDMVNNYIVADYNSGTPIIRNTTTVDEINETTIIPLWTIFREGIHLHILDWDKLGLALANKLNQRLVKTERFSREYGLALSTSGRTVYTTAGKVWYGGAYQLLDAVDSSTDDFFFYYPVSGVWTYDVITEFPNTYYSDGTDRLELGVAKYGSVFIYRGIETSAHIYCVVDGQHNTLASAQASQPPANLPPAITAHTILVGRIIFQKSDTSATEVDSAFVTQFTSTGIVNHNDTSGIQGGNSGEYYHLTSTQYNAINKKTLQVSFKALYGTSPVWKLLDMETGTSIFPNGIQITSIYVKSSEADPTTELSADLKYCDAQGTGAFPSTNPTLIATIDTTTGNYSQTGMTTSIATNKVVYLSLDGASDDSVWTITINYTIL